jgi:hypothetical protein
MGVEEEKHGRRGVQGLEVPWCGVCATGVGRNQQLGALCAGYLSVIICVAAWKAVTSTSSGVDIAGADACGACCLIHQVVCISSCFWLVDCLSQCMVHCCMMAFACVQHKLNGEQDVHCCWWVYFIVTSGLVTRPLGVAFSW